MGPVAPPQLVHPLPADAAQPQANAAQAAANQPHVPPAHGSQRAIIFCALSRQCAVWASAQGGHTLAAWDALRILDNAAVNATIQRLRPKHDNPMVGRAWCWEMTLSTPTPPNLYEFLHHAVLLRCEGVIFKKPKTRDGPLIT